MTKYNLLHFIKTTVLSNGMASLCGSALIFLFIMMSDNDSAFVYITAAVYFFMAMMAGNLASKGLPKDAVARWLPVLFPLAVTAFFWTLCMILSGGNLSSQLFNIYIVSQFTHITAITFAGSLGNPWAALWLPALYNVMFIAAFAYFERVPAKPFKARASNAVPVQTEFAETEDASHDAAARRFGIKQLWIAFSALILICGAVTAAVALS